MKRADKQTPETTAPGVDAEPLQELLRQARHDGFTAKETAEIWNQLSAVLGAPSSGGGSASSGGGAASGAAAAWGAKTIAVLAVAGGLMAAGGLAATGLMGRAWHRAAPAPSSPPPTARSVDRGPPSAVERASVGGGDVERNAETAPMSGMVDPGPSPPGSPPRTDSPSRSSGLRRPLTKAAERRGGVGATESAAESTDAAEATASAPPLPPSDPGPSEAALLLRARRELGANPTETLKLTEQHARLFPTGTLVPEREVLAIEALAQLGRLPEARVRFADFRALFPQSAHLARLLVIVGR